MPGGNLHNYWTFHVDLYFLFIFIENIRNVPFLIAFASLHVHGKYWFKAMFIEHIFSEIKKIHVVCVSISIFELLKGIGWVYK